MEKHRLWPSKWEFHMKTLPCESAFQNIYLFIFQFPFASLASPCSAGSYMTITDCDSSLLCFFFTFWILFNSRSYFSGEGNVTWSSKQSPLRLEGVIITENSTVVWIFSDLQGFFAFPPPPKKKKRMKSLIFFPQWYSTLNMYLSEYWFKSRARDLQTKLFWTAGLLWTTWSQTLGVFLSLVGEDEESWEPCYTPAAASGYSRGLPQLSAYLSGTKILQIFSFFLFFS